MFSKKFSTSIAKLKSTKYIALLGILIALKIAISSNYITIGDNLRVYFTFFIVAIEASIFGPAVSLISGFVSDILGFIIFPSGNFFIGYTISAMLSNFIYAMFLYEQNITILKIALSKITVNLFVNVILGSTWSAIMFKKAYIYYLAKSIVKNTLLLPIEITILVVAFTVLLPILTKKGLIKQSKLPLKLF